MAEPNPNNLPPYTTTDSNDANEEAPPPYQAISSNVPAATNTPLPSIPTTPPFEYNIPPPSYSHSNDYQPSFDTRVSRLILADGLGPPDNEEEPERENSSTVLLYTLAVLTCMVCGFFAGLLFIVLILLGERRSTMPMDKRRKYFLFVSLVVSMISFFFAFVVISWFGYFLKPIPFGGCRYGISYNRTCCPMTVPPSMCHHGIMRRGSNGCRSCCTSEECQLEWRNAHCGFCQEYSTKTDFKGCPVCCKTMDCGSRDVYRNSFNCSSCCPFFDSSSCSSSGKDQVVAPVTGCSVCCNHCLHGKSLVLDKKGCPLCCSEVTCETTYIDKNGCKKCCDDAVLSTCREALLAITNGNSTCDQCCAGNDDFCSVSQETTTSQER